MSKAFWGCEWYRFLHGAEVKSTQPTWSQPIAWTRAFRVKTSLHPSSTNQTCYEYDSPPVITRGKLGNPLVSWGFQVGNHRTFNRVVSSIFHVWWHRRVQPLTQRNLPSVQVSPTHLPTSARCHQRWEHAGLRQSTLAWCHNAGVTTDQLRGSENGVPSSNLLHNDWKWPYK